MRTFGDVVFLVGALSFSLQVVLGLFARQPSGKVAEGVLVRQ
jgi:nitric oxide reductase subunit B